MKRDLFSMIAEQPVSPPGVDTEVSLIAHQDIGELDQAAAEAELRGSLSKAIVDYIPGTPEEDEEYVADTIGLIQGRNYELFQFFQAKQHEVKKTYHDCDKEQPVNSIERLYDVYNLLNDDFPLPKDNTKHLIAILATQQEWDRHRVLTPDRARQQVGEDTSQQKLAIEIASKRSYLARRFRYAATLASALALSGGTVTAVHEIGGNNEIIVSTTVEAEGTVERQIVRESPDTSVYAMSGVAGILLGGVFGDMIGGALTNRAARRRAKRIVSKNAQS